MSKVIIVVRDECIERVYTRRKDIEVEIVDFDTDGDEEADTACEKRLEQIKNAKTYRDILFA